jgi:hypothetical protein
MKKLKSFLESIAARALAIAPIVATFAGGVAGAATALTAGVGLGFACIMAGTYFGFVAGYAAIGRAPEKLTGLPKATFLKDVKTAALLPLQGAVEICRLMSPAFNRAARPKEAASAPAPAIPAPLQQPKP